MASLQKTSWADEIDELEQPRLPKAEETVDENGIITTVEYSVDEDGKKVKITRRIRRTTQKSVVQHQVAERKAWSKFGRERGNKPGPDRATTTVGENIGLKLSAGNKAQENEEKTDDMKAKLSKAGAGKLKCRTCSGDHFTAKCPFKDLLGGIDSAAMEPPMEEEDAAPGGGAGGKYVPPSMRAGGARTGESMGRPGGRDDLPTLRISNLSEDATDVDLRELLANVGRPARVHIVLDHATKRSKGFAFVSFEDRNQAAAAMQKLNGRGYDNLILNVTWSEPREPREKLGGAAPTMLRA